MCAQHGPIWFPLPSLHAGAPSAPLQRPPAHPPREIDLGSLELLPRGKAHLCPCGSTASTSGPVATPRAQGEVPADTVTLRPSRPRHLLLEACIPGPEGVWASGDMDVSSEATVGGRREERRLLGCTLREAPAAAQPPPTSRLAWPPYALTFQFICTVNLQLCAGTCLINLSLKFLQLFLQQARGDQADLGQDGRRGLFPGSWGQGLGALQSVGPSGEPPGSLGLCKVGLKLKSQQDRVLDLIGGGGRCLVPTRQEQRRVWGEPRCPPGQALCP